MRKILIILIIVFVGCKQKGSDRLRNTHYYEERAIFFTLDYYATHNCYPSYWIRECYYNHRDDDRYIDSLINKTPEDK